MILPQIAAMMLAAALSTTTAAAEPKPVTDTQVRRAIEKGREWLQAQQKDDNLWRQQTGPMTPGPCGTSALVAKALMESGSNPIDVVFSATGYSAYGCRGYAPDDAKAVATNIILYVSDRAAKGEGR